MHFCCKHVRSLHTIAQVKLFANRPTLGFSEAEDEAAPQQFSLSEAQAAGEAVPLKCAPWLVQMA